MPPLFERMTSTVSSIIVTLPRKSKTVHAFGTACMDFERGGGDFLLLRDVETVFFSKK